VIAGNSTGSEEEPPAKEQVNEGAVGGHSPNVRVEETLERNLKYGSRKKAANTVHAGAHQKALFTRVEYNEGSGRLPQNHTVAEQPSTDLHAQTVSAGCA